MSLNIALKGFVPAAPAFTTGAFLLPEGASMTTQNEHLTGTVRVRRAHDRGTIANDLPFRGTLDRLQAFVKECEANWNALIGLSLGSRYTVSFVPGDHRTLSTMRRMQEERALERIESRSKELKAARCEADAPQG